MPHVCHGLRQRVSVLMVLMVLMVLKKVATKVAMEAVSQQSTVPIIRGPTADIWIRAQVLLIRIGCSSRRGRRSRMTARGSPSHGLPANPEGGGAPADRLTGRDLVEQLRQQERVAHLAGGEFGRADLQCLLVNPPSRRMCHSPAGQ